MSLEAESMRKLIILSGLLFSVSVSQGKSSSLVDPSLYHLVGNNQCKFHSFLFKAFNTLAVADAIQLENKVLGLNHALVYCSEISVWTSKLDFPPFPTFVLRVESQNPITLVRAALLDLNMILPSTNNVQAKLLKRIEPITHCVKVELNLQRYTDVNFLQFSSEGP